MKPSTIDPSVGRPSWIIGSTLFVTLCLLPGGTTPPALSLENFLILFLGLLGICGASPPVSLVAKLRQRLSGPRPEHQEKPCDAVLEESPVAIIVLDPLGHQFVYANRAARELFGYSRREFRRLPTVAIFANGQLPPWQRGATDAERLVGGEYQCTDRDGREFAADLQIRRLTDGRLVVSFFEVNRDTELERHFLEISEFADGLVQCFPGIFYLFDRAGRMLRWNRNLELVSGYTADEVKQAQPMDFIVADERPFIEEKIRQVFETGKATAESWLLTKDGRRIPFRFNGVKTHFDGVECLAGVGLDLTEREVAEQRIHYLAHYDRLTELPNRLLFSDRLSRALAFAHRYGRELAVLFVDLDGFKDVNDSLGHDAGDTVLKEAAMRIAHCLRESDTVARIGGDEFLVLLPEITSPDEACTVAGKILAALVKPIRIDGVQACVSSSIGIALFPRHGGNEEGLVKTADEAMYQAKRTGKNRFCLPTDTALQTHLF